MTDPDDGLAREIEALMAKWREKWPLNSVADIAAKKCADDLLALLRARSPRVQNKENEDFTRVDGHTVIPPERATAAENQAKDATVTRHSPLPWFASAPAEDEYGYKQVTIGPFALDRPDVDHAEDTIAYVSGVNHDAEANAALILRAVNAVGRSPQPEQEQAMEVEALIASLESETCDSDLKTCIENWPDAPGSWCAGCRMLEAARLLAASRPASQPEQEQDGRSFHDRTSGKGWTLYGFKGCAIRTGDASTIVPAEHARKLIEIHNRQVDELLASSHPASFSPKDEDGADCDADSRWHQFRDGESICICGETEFMDIGDARFS